MPKTHAFRFRLSWLLAIATLSLGCGEKTPYKLAPVSGTITLDGKPVPYTKVTFQPQLVGDAMSAGPASAADCDDAGHFVLKTLRGETGAVVGPHKVTISSTGPPITTGSDDTRPVPKDAFPKQFNAATTLTFTVPEGGTTTADFPLKKKP